MNTTSIDSKTQEELKVCGRIHNFFKTFKISSLLHRCGIRKHHGHDVETLVQGIFILPFIGKNFFRGIVQNKDLSFGKDAAYNLLKGISFNWRNLLLFLAKSVFDVIDPLTSKDRVSVLIIDDSVYDRSRSKRVELLARVFDHCEKTFTKGFRMLTLCWSDGTTTIPVDFSLQSSSTEKNRLCDSQKVIDKRCCAYKRRKEATEPVTAHLEAMVKRALSMGLSAKHLLMDRWFMMPSIIVALNKHIKVIGMVKKTSKIHYKFEGIPLKVADIYRRLKKRPGRAKILTSANILLKGTVPAKLVFVRHKHKRQEWLVLLSTDTSLPDAEIVRIYGKRWNIEVFFKMSKQHLNLAKEIQCRDFDALIAHTTFVFMRYIFIAYQSRTETDGRTFGGMFYQVYDEVADISFVESLYRILTLAVEQLKEMGTFCKKTMNSFLNAIINTALKSVGLTLNNLSTS